MHSCEKANDISAEMFRVLDGQYGSEEGTLDCGRPSISLGHLWAMDYAAAESDDARSLSLYRLLCRAARRPVDLLLCGLGAAHRCGDPKSGEVFLERLAREPHWWRIKRVGQGPMDATEQHLYLTYILHESRYRFRRRLSHEGSQEAGVSRWRDGLQLATRQFEIQVPQP